MKGILVLPTMLLAGMAWADWMYNPNNPNPTQHDVWKAEQNAFEHGQRAAEAMSLPDTWVSIREQEKANQARRDADQMRMRMWENERIENERRERVRREEESQSWQQRQGSDDMLVVPGASASMLKHINKKRAQRRQQVNFNGNGWGVQQDDDDEEETPQEQRAKLIMALQPTPYPGGVDREGCCFFCGARLLGRQRLCAKHKTQGPPQSYYDWKAREQKKARLLKELLAQ